MGVHDELVFWLSDKHDDVRYIELSGADELG